MLFDRIETPQTAVFGYHFLRANKRQPKYHFFTECSKGKMWLRQKIAWHFKRIACTADGKLFSETADIIRLGDVDKWESQEIFQGWEWEVEATSFSKKSNQPFSTEQKKASTYSDPPKSGVTRVTTRYRGSCNTLREAAIAGLQRLFSQRKQPLYKLLKMLDADRLMFVMGKAFTTTSRK
jgi:hypothetical protein